MHLQRGVCAVALAAAMTLPAAAARAADDSKYPDFTSQWSRGKGAAGWDQTKGGGLAQQPPLTPQYQAKYEAILKAVNQEGSEVFNDQARCLPSGMPRMMIAYEPIEVIVTPKITYVRVDHDGEFRRIYTDGRDWPAEIEPSFAGFSIGKWVDESGSGRYNVLEAETRAIKGPHYYDANGIPFADDDQAVIKERMYLDKSDPNILKDDLTSYDHALTRPWTVTRSYYRNNNAPWHEHICEEDNHHVMIGKESYFLSADELLMPTRKDQPPPDLKYFKQTAK